MKSIAKEGIVREVKDNCVTVAVTSCSACHHCQAKVFCGLSESKEKLVEIETLDASAYKKGDAVVVLMSLANGYSALVLGYLVPLLVMVVTIVTFSLCGYDDFISGISGIIVLIPYYFGIFLLNKKLKSIFSFKLEHKN